VAKSVESPSNARDERIFVKDGFRSYRRTYKLGEVYWGLGTGAVLLGILGWVGWKGAHPDPALFDISASLIADPKARDMALADQPRSNPASRDKGPGSAEAASPSGEHEAVEPASSAAREPAANVSRGALPAGLANGQFREGKLGEFSSDNLYVKINGRAGYFQSFGVKSLHAITLEAGEGSAAPGASIDIELYDLGESRNALGAYNGERAPTATSQQSEGSAYHIDRNAGFLARGSYYARFIGSDESPSVVAEVQRLLELFRKELPAGTLPWGYELFVGQLKLEASKVTYVKENAFSFGFARDVYKATLSAPDATDDIEAFVGAASDEAAAKALAKKYSDGFASLGAPAGKTKAGVLLSKDEFLGSFAGATAVERWVVGFRGVPSAAEAEELLGRLVKGVTELPGKVRARAVPSADDKEEAEAIDEH
jgi:hypothetical protein